MSEFVVAVPSYKRVSRCAESTLATLARGGVAPELITVFVADEQEATAYEAGLPRGLYGNIVITEKGIANSRNRIVKHYPDGQLVVSFDDDVREVLQLREGKLVPEADLPALFRLAFGLCRRHGARIWGIYPVCNAFFMKSGYTTDLRQIIGLVHGFTNSHALPPMLCPDKEDIERTLQFYSRDGSVVRFNDRAAKQRAWDEPGGLQTPGGRTSEGSRQVSAYLCREFKGLCFPAKEMHGFAQVKLKDTIGLGERLRRLRGLGGTRRSP